MTSKKPPVSFRLTLKRDAVIALAKAPKKPFIFMPMIARPDGGADVAVSISIADQLMTAARPRENLSDTVLRILSLTKA